MPKIYLSVTKVGERRVFCFECKGCLEKFNIPEEYDKEVLLNCHQLFWQAHYACKDLSSTITIKNDPNNEWSQLNPFWRPA